MPAPKRFQVFVSSTFTDLQDERVAVTSALLKALTYFPTGMELFPSSSRPPWDVIRPLLDVTDYMVLLIAGRYGSVDEQGISYTEREYDYAFGTGIPVVAFEKRGIPSLADSAKESDEVMREKLQRFVDKVRGRHTVQTWDSPPELALSVVMSLYQEIDARPRPGWIRGTTPPDDASDSPLSAPSADSPDGNPLAAGGARSVTPAARKRVLRRAIDQILKLDAVTPRAAFDGSIEERRAAHSERLASIETASRPLVQAVFGAVGAADVVIDADLLGAIPDLAPNLRLSGSTDLINLTRSPGVLLFHALGVSAAAHGRDELIGQLLGPHVEVEDPYRGDAPAAAVLTPDVIYPMEWPSRRLFAFLQPIFVDELGERSALGAWEKWTYLHAAAVEFLAAAGQGYRSSWPYLQVESAPNETRLRTVVGRRLVREFAQQGQAHALLSAGAFDGAPEFFEAAAETFESNYATWAREQDWSHLPAGGGILPSNPHYPGDRSGIAE